MPFNARQPSLKEKLREVRAGLILDIAEEILVEKGYHNTSIDEITARASIAKGTLYQHFLSKEDLVLALVERKLAVFEQAVEQAATSGATARAKLEHILRSIYQAQSGLGRQLFQLISHDADVRNILIEKKRQMQDRLNQLAGQIRAILEEGKAQGAFEPTISTELMLATFLSLLSLEKRVPLSTQEQIPPEELLTQVQRILFAGIAVHSPT